MSDSNFNETAFGDVVARHWAELVNVRWLAQEVASSTPQEGRPPGGIGQGTPGGVKLACEAASLNEAGLELEIGFETSTEDGTVKLLISGGACRITEKTSFRRLPGTS